MIGKFDRIAVHMDKFFPDGAFLTTPVTPVMVFDNGKATTRQEIDEHTKLRKWTCTILDNDPEATGPAKSIKVTLLAEVQPVPPAPQIPGFPLAAVAFGGLEVKPRAEVIMSGQRARIVWSFFARELLDPMASTPAKSAERVPATSGAK